MQDVIEQPVREGGHDGSDCRPLRVRLPLSPQQGDRPLPEQRRPRESCPEEIAGPALRGRRKTWTGKRRRKPSPTRSRSCRARSGTCWWPPSWKAAASRISPRNGRRRSGRCWPGNTGPWRPCVRRSREVYMIASNARDVAGSFPGGTGTAHRGPRRAGRHRGGGLRPGVRLAGDDPVELADAGDLPPGCAHLLAGLRDRGPGKADLRRHRRRRATRRTRTAALEERPFDKTQGPGGGRDEWRWYRDFWDEEGRAAFDRFVQKKQGAGSESSAPLA